MALKNVNNKERAILYGDNKSRIVRTEKEMKQILKSGVSIGGYPAPIEHKGWFYNTDTSEFGLMTGFFIPDSGEFIAEVHDREAFYENYRRMA